MHYVHREYLAGTVARRACFYGIGPVGIPGRSDKSVYFSMSQGRITVMTRQAS